MMEAAKQQDTDAPRARGLSLTQDQLEARRKFIGGSDAGAVLGLSPYRTPYDVWTDKTGRADPLEDNDAMFWGRTLEDVVAKEYAARSGHKVRRRGTVIGKHPWMGAHLDRVIVGEDRGPGVLEIKTAGTWSANRFGEEGSDHVPDEYIAQVQHYLAVTGYTWARLAVLIGGVDFRIFNIARDEELIRSLIEVERKFWFDHVVADVPPPAQTLGDLRQLHPTDDGSTVCADETTERAIYRLKEIKAEVKALEGERKELEFTIQNRLGGASTLTDPDGNTLATWKTQCTRRLDTKALKAAHPDLAEQFTNESTMRVLRIK